MAKQADFQEIVQFECNYFFKECPPDKYLNIMDNPNSVRLIEHLVRISLEDNMAIVVKDPNNGNKIIGVATSSPLHVVEPVKDCTFQNWQIIEEWLEYTYEMADCVKAYNTKNIFVFDRCKNGIRKPFPNVIRRL